MHPLNVESVAWIAERKNVLSTLFWILALLGYARYAQRPSVARMGLVILAMGFGLMTKGMLVTLPCALLLLDWWPLQRAEKAGWFRLVMEKIPLFLLSAAFSVVTTLAAANAKALAPVSAIPLLERLMYVSANSLRYLGKLFYPADLAILYPNPVTPPVVLACIGFIVLGLITFATFRVRKTSPWLLIGWLWFLGTLFPVSGIVPLGKTIFAERFTYVPQIGLFMAVVCGVSALARHRPVLLRPLAASGGLAIAALSMVTVQYVEQWDDTASLFGHAVKSTRGNFFAHGTLGWALSRQGDLEGAARNYIAALQINPAHSEARANLGAILSRAGKTEAAIEQFKRALEYDPADYSARFNLATHLILQKKSEDAVVLLEALLSEPRPEPRLHYWLGRALTDVGRRAEAASHLRAALAATPHDESIREALQEVDQAEESSVIGSLPDNKRE